MRLVARPPLSIDVLADRYGPHRNYAPPGGWAEAARRPADALVKTHCSFCGMQCGIQLKVRDNQVVGFEPWEEFPFNHGMLCPKGVKRYLQGAHPDRLTQCLTAFSSGRLQCGSFRCDRPIVGLTQGGIRRVFAESLMRHATGYEAAYGNGALDKKVGEKFNEIFERECEVFFVGTAVGWTVLTRMPAGPSSSTG